jgi:hypothetical protein
MQGFQTIENVRKMALEIGIEAKPEDLKFILEVVGKSDPWFEGEASGPIFAARFRNYVISRCQTAGMQLSSDEIDLIDAWFGGEATAAANEPSASQTAPAEREAEPIQAPETSHAPSQPSVGGVQAPFGDRTAAWWEETRAATAEDLATAGANDGGGEDFPRIVRNRFRG